MMDIYLKLNELGIELPKPTAKAGIYKRTVCFADRLVYVSGTGPASDMPTGKLGKELTVEQGMEAARSCALNILANLHDELGDLNRIKRFVKLLVFVSSNENFYDQPQVGNGASSLLCEVFGTDCGVATRSAIGVPVLPGNIPVEVEALLELKDE